MEGIEKLNMVELRKLSEDINKELIVWIDNDEMTAEMKVLLLKLIDYRASMHISKFLTDETVHLYKIWAWDACVKSGKNYNPARVALLNSKTTPYIYLSTIIRSSFAGSDGKFYHGWEITDDKPHDAYKI